MAVDAAKDALIRKRVFVGALSNYAGTVISLVVWFVLTPFILDRIGAAGYGIWTLVGSLVGYGSLLDFGIGPAVVKYVAEYRAREETEAGRSLVATAVRIYAVVGLVLLGLAVALASGLASVLDVPSDLRADAVWLVLLMGASVAISIAFTPASSILRGLQRYDLYNLVSTSGSLLVAAVTAAALLAGGGVVAMVAVTVPVTLATQLAAVLLVRRVAPELGYGWSGASRSMARRLFSFGTAMFVAQLSARLQTRTDEIVIGAYLSVASVTPYALARRLTEIGHRIPDQFIKVILPLASELHASDDPARLRTLYVVSTRLTIALFLPVAICLIILADAILTAWVGPRYAGSAHLVVILTVASLIVTSQWPAGSVLQGMARYRLLAFSSLASGVANLLLSIALVGPFGITGVAFGTLIPTTLEALGFVLPYALWVMRLRPAEALKSILLPALVPAAPMAVVVYGLRQAIGPLDLASIAAISGVGFLVYLALYLSMPATMMERDMSRQVVRGTLRLAERLRAARS